MIVALFKTRDLPALAAYRHHDGWEVSLSEDDTCFVRLRHTDSEEELLPLPCLKRWILSENSQLIPVGKTLPERTLPTLSWLPLHNLLPAIPLASKDNEEFFGHLSFTLRADTELREPAGLVLDFSTFANWVETAPEPRLNRLTFAVSEEGKVIVLGTPLPPLSGASIYQESQILLPSGLALPPYILPEDLSEGSREFLMIEKDGTVHRIGSELFITASRAAVRLTSRSLN